MKIKAIPKEAEINIDQEIESYKQDLINNELSAGTIRKYMRDIEQLRQYLKANNKELDKASMIEYKEHLIKTFKTSTVNNKIVTTNKFLKYIGLDELTVKAVRVQTRFTNDDVMTQTDYNRLIRVATNRGLKRDVLMLQVFYFTGLRVSELQHFTVEAVKSGIMEIENKGKVRRVPIPRALSKEAKEYIKANNIEAGAIISNNRGEALSRFTVYGRMKYIAGQARVKKDRIYPHSLRHLFAKNWLKANGNNVIQLADILGHESLETTRLYTKLSIDEIRKTMEF